MLRVVAKTNLCCALLTVAVLASLGCGGSVELPATRVELRDGWSLQSAVEIEADGIAISQPGFDSGSWISGSAPSTVMAALVADGQYPDLYFADNLEQVPQERFTGAWWYRTEFELAPEDVSRVTRLALDGINYSANIWLNGEQLADRDTIVGAFRMHEIDLAGRVTPGINALAIEVFPPLQGDFTIGFVDWNPTPPDRNMGVWRPVALRFSGDVSLNDVFVTSDVDTETLTSADVQVSGVVVNHSSEKATAAIRGEFGDVSFSKTIDLEPYERQALIFGADAHPELHLEAPELWWPYTLGEPHLYSLRMTVEIDGQISDAVEVDFGVREVSSYFNEEGHRGFKVNGKSVLIRGGGWVDDLLLANTPEKISAQMEYVKHLGLNTVRLEGFWGSDSLLYDIADQEGVLLMPGWSCQWEWEEYLGKPVDEYGGVTTPEEMNLVAASMADQARWLRNHPSVFTWVLASDLLPRPNLEKRYEETLSVVDPSRPRLSTCAWLDSEISGPSGVKMKGPYEWVPPVYWYSDTENGGAYGFNTETGPGAQPPPLESLKKMIPEQSLWPIDGLWDYHCGRNEFNTAKRFVDAVDARYGSSESVEEFLLKAQVTSYEAMRPMFEAFAVKRPLATGVVQWMLNSAWPEMFWQLYDYYLLPNGAFYGARAACRPQSVAYDYADQSVWAVNETLERASGVEVSVRAFDLNAQEIWNTTHRVNVESGAPVKVTELGAVESPTPVWFLDLRMSDAAGRELARNFYWMSNQLDELDYAKHDWFFTPVKRHADFGSLNELPRVEVSAEYVVARVSDRWEATVTVSNPSESLAFFVELRLADPEDGASLVPVLWEDNYISLLPGESRQLSVEVLQQSVGPSPVLEVSGWNVAPASYEPNLS